MKNLGMFLDGTTQCYKDISFPKVVNFIQFYSKCIFYHLSHQGSAIKMHFLTCQVNGEIYIKD